ncbi:MAG: uroporphyrinogen decarboxylase family protein [Chloroflexota bacterium]
MNGRERVLTALQRGQPDRVPVLELAVDKKVIEGIVPGGGMPAFVESLDLDAIGAGPVYRRDNLPDNLYRDEWGTVYYDLPELIGSPLDGPIHSPADFARYAPPDPLAPERLGDLPEYVRRFKGQRAIVWHQREAFMTTALLAGLERFLMMIHDEPELVRRMVDMVVDVHVALVRRAVRAGADVVSLGDDYAWRTGPMMSPAAFKEFFLPGIKRVVAAAHEEGALCFKHCDGNIWPLLDYFVEAGFEGVNPLEPIAGMDLGEVKRRYGDKVCLLGNVDCGYVLCEASETEVVADVKRCLREGAPGGGYIITSSNSLHSSVRPENYLTMVNAARRFGQYPLDIESLR